MALLQITCNNNECEHMYYRIAVQCEVDKIELECPECGNTEGKIHVVPTPNGETPFAPCTHTSD